MVEAGIEERRQPIDGRTTPFHSELRAQRNSIAGFSLDKFATRGQSDEGGLI